MKVTISFAFVAVCISACYSAPAAAPTIGHLEELQNKLRELQSAIHPNAPVHPHFTDWFRVTALVRVLGSDANSLFENIKTTTGNAEESLKARIFAKVDASSNQTDILFNEIADHVTNQSLSRKHTVELETNLYNILDTLLENLQEELDQLSTIIANTITNLINNAKTDVSRLSEELYLILPIYWPEVRQFAKTIHSETAIGGFDRIIEIAKNEDDQVGARIETLLNEFTDLFFSIYQQNLADAIDDESLTVNKISGYCSTVQLAYRLVDMYLQPETDKLPLPVSYQIYEILNFNYQSVPVKAEELKALLRQENY